MNRRTLLTGLAALPGAAQAAPAAFAGADDEAYWRGIAAQYDVTREVIQLENGNWGMMARPVLESYKEQLARVNRDTSYYTRRRFGGRHPLCGIGVTSRIASTFRPTACSARNADSRPAPGPLTSTSKVRMP